jgi:hypothetical protein
MDPELRPDGADRRVPDHGLERFPMRAQKVNRLAILAQARQMNFLERNPQ